MEVCKICGRECENIRGLSSHLKSHNLTSKEYYDTYLKKENEGICSECGKETTFKNINLGYNLYCSCLCLSNSEIIKIKKEKTSLNNYGEIHPFKSKIVKDKIKQTCIEKYGVDNPNKNKKVRKKYKQTCIEKFGYETPFQNEEIKDKIKNACIKKYGVNHYTKTDEYKRYHKTIIFKNIYNKLLNSDRLKGLVTPLFNIDEYNGINKKYLFKCVKCNNEFEDNINNGRVPRCYNCYPRKIILESNLEKEIYNFLLTFLNKNEITCNNRSILNGKELDIYIPSKSLSIEFNGLYWHSELNGGVKTYHLNKTLLCKEKEISLLHIFEDEWIEKQEIVKSIIKSKLGLIENKIAARKCILKEANKDEAFNFLDSNHIQGFINGKHIGLYYNNELVSLLTYDKPRFNNEYDVEILRFCSKLNTIVIGGLSKLVKHINSNSIISYCDLRYGDGHSYEKCEFKKISKSAPSYFYLNKNYTGRLSRMQFQKHKLKDKLKIFDPNLTEWQNMQLNGYDRIWDCGCNVYVKEVK